MKSLLVDDGLKAQSAALKQREANTSLIWEPSVATRKPAFVATIAIEAELVALIERPINSAETHRAGNDRKERELCALLDRLSDLEAHTLRQRLSAARGSDPLVASSRRISADRRARIVAFIEDTRRRNALRR